MVTTSPARNGNDVTFSGSTRSRSVPALRTQPPPIPDRPPKAPGGGIRQRSVARPVKTESVSTRMSRRTPTLPSPTAGAAGVLPEPEPLESHRVLELVGLDAMEGTGAGEDQRPDHVGAIQAGPGAHPAELRINERPHPPRSSSTPLMV